MNKKPIKPLITIIKVFMNINVSNFEEKLLRKKNSWLNFILMYKHLIFFCIYISLFLCFVIKLKKGYLRYQIRLFFWTHCVLLFTIGLSLGMLMIYEGLIWLLLSAISGKFGFV